LVLSHGTQFMLYTLVEYHQVTAQPVVKLCGDINSCYKITSLALKALVRLLIPKRILMLSCGSCCVGLRQFFGSALSLTFSAVWCDLHDPKVQRSSFWQTYGVLLQSLVSWMRRFSWF